MYGHWALDTREERGECDGAQVGWEREAFHSPNNVSKYTPWAPPPLVSLLIAHTLAFKYSPLYVPLIFAPFLTPSSSHIFLALSNTPSRSHFQVSLSLSLSLYFNVFYSRLNMNAMLLFSPLQSHLLIFQFPYSRSI